MPFPLALLNLYIYLVYSEEKARKSQGKAKEIVFLALYAEWFRIDRLVETTTNFNDKFIFADIQKNKLDLVGIAKKFFRSGASKLVPLIELSNKEVKLLRKIRGLFGYSKTVINDLSIVEFSRRQLFNSLDYINSTYYPRSNQGRHNSIRTTLIYILA